MQLQLQLQLQKYNITVIKRLINHEAAKFTLGVFSRFGACAVAMHI